MKSILYERLGEQIFALINENQIIELKISRFNNFALLGQEYCARIKTIDMRISAAFLDIGDEQVILPFNAPRPKYMVEGALVIIKIIKPKIGNKSGVVKYIGDAGSKYSKPTLIKDANPWGDWQAPVLANQEEIELIELSLENIQNPVIGLKNGGNIAIETTRAMTTIDIDASTRMAGGKNQNNFNHKLNIEACKEIIRQIILRNIGGLIIIDFVGAPSKLEAIDLLAILQNELPKFGKCEILPISKFGLCEIARAKNGASIVEILNANLAETIAINAINKLSKKLLIAKGNIVKLEINQSAYEFLVSWHIDWKNYIKEKIGGNYEIFPKPMEGFEII